ncbi:MAG: ABC transporter ATP-binding protein [Alphaproteobacteria bacterium]|nr:ABC transporter ATP-binding protein [Alphaproteobacteria bacterium]
MLEIEGIDVAYGPIPALRGLSLRVGQGEIVTLIGANGAGKSTLIKAVAGLLPKRAGRIRFDGQDIGQSKAPDIARRGLTVVPEGRRLFGPMTVTDNLMLGAYPRLLAGRRAEVEGDLEKVFALFPRLRERARQTARTLSGGEQQMVAIGRGLMAAPKALLIDEPSTGLAPLVMREIFRALAGLRESGITVLLVEQNARMALRLADRAYVLELGRIALEGRASDLAREDSVRRLYLAS